EGGKHVTYWHRFPDIHQGMLWLENVPGVPYPLIHIGNRATDTTQSIVLGKNVKLETDAHRAREVWFSDRAYLSLYQTIIHALSQNRRVEVVITETNS
ncbi:MAG: DUF5675 family protein, partial [Bacteroidota bacterium]